MLYQVPTLGYFSVLKVKVLWEQFLNYLYDFRKRSMNLVPLESTPNAPIFNSYS